MNYEAGIELKNESNCRALRAAVRLACLQGVCAAGLLSGALAHAADVRPAVAIAAEAAIAFDIPAQSLETALLRFSEQARIQVVVANGAARGAMAPQVKGEFSAAQALHLLLEESALTYEVTDERTVAIRAESSANRISTTSHSSSGRQPALISKDEQVGPNRASHGAKPQDSYRMESRVDLEEVIVTGTNIRGVNPDSSPIHVYTADDIQRSGATTTEQFLQRLPQNLATRTSISARYVGGEALNQEGANSIDLRGLGVGTTLVLLNGRRMALAGQGEAVDISSIPLSAIERVEVLTDGASAIYGSEAIGGVVNFVLRKELDTAETRIGYGSVSKGNLHQIGLSHVQGAQWGSGSMLGSYSFHDASALERKDRSYVLQGREGDLTPNDERHSALLTLSQRFANGLVLDADFMYSRQEINSSGTSLTSSIPGAISTTWSDSDQLFVNAGAQYALSDDWDASVLATYSTRDSKTRSESIDTINVYDARYSAYDLTAKVEGSLVSLPAGDLKLSSGVGLTDETLRGGATGVRSGNTQGRETTYAFGEVFVPILAGAPLAHRLELSLAARYTHYEDASSPNRLDQDFGGRTSPKIGLLWAPTPSLNVRGTYGESFRAASLIDVDPDRGAVGIFDIFPVRSLPAAVLVAAGAAPKLKPETATTYTAGFDFEPSAIPSLRLSATYFNVEYVDKIDAVADAFLALADPDRYPEAVYQTASSAVVAQMLASAPVLANMLNLDISDPVIAAEALVSRSDFWILDNRNRNLSSSRMDGFDVSLRYAFSTGIGEVGIALQGTKLLSYTKKATASSEPNDVLDSVLNPIDLRVRTVASVSNRGFSSSVNINYIDDYSNPLGALVGGSAEVASWTTVDVMASYELGNELSGALSGLTIGLSVQNIFDKDPPYVASHGSDSNSLFAPIGFDPVNANPLGRFVMINVSKTW